MAPYDVIPCRALTATHYPSPRQHSGWLRPRSERLLSGGWNKRKWFLLSNHVLYYFDSVPKDAAEEGPKASVRVTDDVTDDATL